MVGGVWGHSSYPRPACLSVYQSSSYSRFKWQSRSNHKHSVCTFSQRLAIRGMSDANKECALGDGGVGQKYWRRAICLKGAFIYNQWLDWITGCFHHRRHMRRNVTIAQSSALMWSAGSSWPTEVTHQTQRWLDTGILFYHAELRLVGGFIGALLRWRFTSATEGSDLQLQCGGGRPPEVITDLVDSEQLLKLLNSFRAK